MIGPRVRRFLPKLTGIHETLQSMEFKWRRLLMKEYGATYAWTAGMILLVLKNLWLAGQPTPLLFVLEGLLVVLTIGYGCVRYLKKSGIVTHVNDNTVI